jgi:hypothetical protein
MATAINDEHDAFLISWASDWETVASICNVLLVGEPGLSGEDISIEAPLAPRLVVNIV